MMGDQGLKPPEFEYAELRAEEIKYVNSIREWEEGIRQYKGFIARNEKLRKAHEEFWQAHRSQYNNEPHPTELEARRRLEKAGIPFNFIPEL